MCYFLSFVVKVRYNQECFVLHFAAGVLPPVLSLFVHHILEKTFFKDFYVCSHNLQLSWYGSACC